MTNDSSTVKDVDNGSGSAPPKSASAEALLSGSNEVDLDRKVSHGVVNVHNTQIYNPNSRRSLERAIFDSDHYRYEETALSGELYVRPPYHDHLKRGIEGRVVVLCGHRGVGRMTAVHYAAWRAKQQGTVGAILRVPDDVACTAQSFLERLPPGVFVIIDDGFSKGKSLSQSLLSDCTEVQVNHIRNRLRGGILVVITERERLDLPDRRFAELVAEYVVVEANDVADPADVLHRLLAKHYPAGSMRDPLLALVREECLEQTAIALRLPRQIGRFVESCIPEVLKCTDSTAAEQCLQRWLEVRTSDIDGFQEYWQGLPDSARTMAVTAALFHRTEADVHWLLHNLIVRSLREHDAVHKAHKRESLFAAPTSRTLRQIRASLIHERYDFGDESCRVPVIQLDEQRLVDQVVEYVIDNYPEFMRISFRVLVRELLRRSAQRTVGDPVAAAVGSIAAVDWTRIVELIHDLGVSGKPGTIEVAGTILAVAYTRQRTRRRAFQVMLDCEPETIPDGRLTWWEPSEFGFLFDRGDFGGNERTVGLANLVITARGQLRGERGLGLILRLFRKVTQSSFGTFLYHFAVPTGDALARIMVAGDVMRVMDEFHSFLDTHPVHRGALVETQAYGAQSTAEKRQGDAIIGLAAAWAWILALQDLAHWRLLDSVVGAGVGNEHERFADIMALLYARIRESQAPIPLLVGKEPHESVEVGDTYLNGEWDMRDSLVASYVDLFKEWAAEPYRNEEPSGADIMRRIVQRLDELNSNHAAHLRRYIVSHWNPRVRGGLQQSIIDFITQ